MSTSLIPHPIFFRIREARKDREKKKKINMAIELTQDETAYIDSFIEYEDVQQTRKNPPVDVFKLTPKQYRGLKLGSYVNSTKMMLNNKYIKKVDGCDVYVIKNEAFRTVEGKINGKLVRCKKTSKRSPTDKQVPLRMAVIPETRIEADVGTTVELGTGIEDEVETLTGIEDEVETLTEMEAETLMETGVETLVDMGTEMELGVETKAKAKAKVRSRSRRRKNNDEEEYVPNTEEEDDRERAIEDELEEKDREKRTKNMRLKMKKKMIAEERRVNKEALIQGKIKRRSRKKMKLGRTLGRPNALDVCLETLRVVAEATNHTGDVCKVAARAGLKEDVWETAKIEVFGIPSLDILGNSTNNACGVLKRRGINSTEYVLHDRKVTYLVAELKYKDVDVDVDIDNTCFSVRGTNTKSRGDNFVVSMWFYIKRNNMVTVFSHPIGVGCYGIGSTPIDVNRKFTASLYTNRWIVKTNMSVVLLTAQGLKSMHKNTNHTFLDFKKRYRDNCISNHHLMDTLGADKALAKHYDEVKKKGVRKRKRKRKRKRVRK